MPTLDAALSLRVPADLKTRLEGVATRTHRSRAYLTIAALQKYLNEVEQEEMKTAPISKYELASRYRGTGIPQHGAARSVKEIDAMVHDLRGDE